MEGDDVTMFPVAFAFLFNWRRLLYMYVARVFLLLQNGLVRCGQALYATGNDTLWTGSRFGRGIFLNLDTFRHDNFTSSLARY